MMVYITMAMYITVDYKVKFNSVGMFSSFMKKNEERGWKNKGEKSVNYMF